MKKGSKAKVVIGAALAATVVAGTAATVMGYGPFSSKAASLASYFSTNPSGAGKQASVTIDGSFSDWDSSMLIAQGVANDDPRSFRGPHEGPVYDTYALYGSWDNDNLYLMWEITNLTDVVAPEQDYPQSDNGKAWNGDIPQIVALDIDPNASADGSITGTGKGVWGMNINYTNGVDALLCFSSKVGVGTPALFTLDGSGAFSYADEYCQGFKDLGITYAFGDGHISSKLMGIKANGYTGLTTDMMFSDSSAWVDLNSQGHKEAQDTMYEMAIPLSALGIDSHYLTENGIGVMHISTFGESAIQSLPVDPCIYDNASEPYTADESTSQEKADSDTFSVELARLGKASGGTSVKTPAPATKAPATTAPADETETPVDETETPADETETPFEVIDGTTVPPVKQTATPTPVPTDALYGKADNNDHSKETSYTIVEKQGSSSSSSNVKFAADKMCEGTILHAWCWSFNTIKNNLADIKAAGYTSVQTSPAQWCVTGNGGDRSVRNWYFHYQPTGYGIGNYQMGSEAEFKTMCAEAEKYGIKIIVDCVFNHMTSDWGQIASQYQKGEYFHTNEGVGNWDSRWCQTQQAILGLWDLNTQNSDIQQYSLNYAKQCVADGADGFRYDAAKHIELPDDSGFGGNFWPVVLNNGSEFQYGEVLQDKVSRDGAYSAKMGVTASGYGFTIRDAVANNNVNSGKLLNYGIDAGADRTVTWVESHDNFANDDCATVWMTNEQIKLAWACLAARKGGTPLFYNRPVGAGGTSYDSRFPGKSQLGDAGDSFYKDDEIAAVNIFRNMMEGESENLKNIDGDSVLMVERGTKGVVIVNTNYSSKSVNVSTSLANGEYTNRTDDGSKFNVSNGKLTGTVPSRAIAVLYNGGTTVVNAPTVGISGYTENVNNSYTTDGINLTLTTSNSTAATYSINNGTSYKYTSGKSIKIGAGCDYGTQITVTLKAENNDASKSATYIFTKIDPTAGLNVSFTKPSGWGSTIYAYIYKESGSSVSQVAAWPGVAMEGTSGNNFKLQLSDLSFNGANIIFSDGSNQSPAAKEPGFIIENGASYTIDGKSSSGNNNNDDDDDDDNNNSDKMVIYYYTSWNNANIHYSIDGGEWTSVPGVQMTSAGTGIKKAEISMTSGSLKFCFNDGNGSWDSNSGNDYSISSVGTYTVKDGKVTSGAPSGTESSSTNTSNSVTIYYKTDWNANCHYSIGGGDWTTVPGVAMTAGSNGYKVISIDLGSASNVTACFNNGSGNWDSNNGNNYYFGSAGSYTVSNGSISNSAPY